MAHGGGGRETKELIESVFAGVFGSDSGEDAFTVGLASDGGAPTGLASVGFSPSGLESAGRLAFTTDSYVVTPVEFAGGDIGRLAVCGTVNDLLTSGARPRFLSAAFIIEEGFDTETLARIARSMKETADEAGVRVVTGDTKVIEKALNRESTVFINTAGIGFLPGWPLPNPQSADLEAARPCGLGEAITSTGLKPGNKLIVTGTMGDHHACILSARMGLTNHIKSDAAPLTDVVSALIAGGVRVTGLRDITRGGLAGVLNEFGVGAEMEDAAIPVAEEVRGLCGILGLDPLYMGNEGKMLIAVEAGDAERALQIISRARYCARAALVGELVAGTRVVLNTAYGRRVLPPMTGEGLPRIC